MASEAIALKSCPGAKASGKDPGIIRQLRAVSAGGMVEALPIVETARRRLQDAIAFFETAETDHAKWKVEVDSGRLGGSKDSYFHTERRRIARGILSVSGLPDIIILLSEDPSDATAKRALEILREHGVSNEVKAAAAALSAP